MNRKHVIVKGENKAVVVGSTKMVGDTTHL